MSKKHFIALADCLRGLKPNPQFDDLALAQWEDFVQAIANFCQSQNSRFKRERWLAYIAGECGPNGGRL